MKEIIINVDKQKNKNIMLVENGKLIEQYVENKDTKRLEGNIYIGKVQNVLEGMQSAFIDIGEGKNTFIHLKDILPKVDSKVENIEEKVRITNIKDVIKSEDNIIVQVKRDSTNKKGARVSTHINLTGRYVVLMPNATFVTVSQKIEEEQERKRLIEIIKNNLIPTFGAIIRTSAINKSEKEIKKDIDQLIKQWENVIEQDTTGDPKLVYQSQGIIKRILIDLIDQDIEKITLNDEEEYENIKNILKQLDANIEVKLNKEDSLLGTYELDNQLEKVKNRKIWLKCGGFITIDKTEALTAIDVNSGKFIGNKNLEETVFKVNQEASIEIAKQIRLRDIGGIIIIDYIDMHIKENKEKVINILKENLKKDRSKTQIVGFTELNLLEMTRKHMCSND